MCFRCCQRQLRSEVDDFFCSCHYKTVIPCFGILPIGIGHSCCSLSEMSAQLKTTKTSLQLKQSAGCSPEILSHQWDKENAATRSTFAINEICEKVSLTREKRKPSPEGSDSQQGGFVKWTEKAAPFLAIYSPYHHTYSMCISTVHYCCHRNVMHSVSYRLTRLNGEPCPICSGSFILVLF